jgi:SAM-dependent methyltransferase
MFAFEYYLCDVNIPIIIVISQSQTFIDEVWGCRCSVPVGGYSANRFYCSWKECLPLSRSSGLFPTLAHSFDKEVECRFLRTAVSWARFNRYLEAEKLGASEVIGIDNSLSIAAIELIIPHLRSHVRMYERNLYDLRKEEMGLFDVICMPGVLYHLRYPIYGLAVLRDLLHDRGYLLIETAVAIFEEQVPLLYCPFGKEGPYFPDLTSVSFFNLKGLTQTLASMGMELQRAEYLHAPSAVPDKPFSSLRKFFARRKPPFPRIDRCCLLCRKNKAPLDDVDLAYWEGTHKFQLG